MSTETVFSLLGLAVMGFAAYKGVKWVMGAGHAYTSGDPPLSAADLRVLEETAGRLIMEITAVADECVARIERACAEADRRTGGLHAGGTPGPTDSELSGNPESGEQSLAQMVASTQAPSEVARLAGLTTGEVELLRGLQTLDIRL